MEDEKLVRFEGTRCPDGYTLRESRIYPASKRTEHYLADPEAFHRFADAFRRFAKVPPWRKWIEGTRDDPRRMLLRPNAEAIVAFANEYGALGNSGDGELVDYWRKEINEMRVALDTLATADWDGSTLSLDSDDWLVRHDEPPGEPLSPTEARQRLRAALNRKLTGSATLQAEIVGERFRWHIRPESLLAALWAQLLEAVSTGQTIRRCEGCSKWMVIDPWGKESGARRNRRTCSDLCRVTVNNRFRHHALELKGKKPLKEIGEKLKADGWRPSGDPVAQIREWFKQDSKKKRGPKK
jgi:hypothetical protein